MPRFLASRRHFLATTGAVAASICAPAVLRFARAEDALVPVRLPAHELDASHPVVKSFKAAILVMRGSKGRPDYHPAHWQQLRRYHAQLCGPNGESDPRVDVHGTWWFLPWHRAYLAVAEQLMREDSGDPTFALPYWDWHRHPKLPPIFEGDPETNPLAHASRVVNDDGTIANWERVRRWWERLDTAAEASEVMPDEFERFAGGPVRVEPDGRILATQPSVDPIHGRGHLYIGGYLGDMGAFPTAGLDPIFYCHHANLDRIWEVWRNATREGAPQRKEPSDQGEQKAWGDRMFAFQDALGGALIVKSSDVVDTRKVKFARYSATEGPELVLSYRYARDKLDAPLPPATPPRPPEVVALDFAGPRALSDQPLMAHAPKDASRHAFAKARREAPAGRVLLTIRGLEVPDRTTLVTTALKLADGRRIEAQIDPMIPFGAAGEGATFAEKVIDLTDVVRREGLGLDDFTVEITADSRQGATPLKLDGIELNVQ